jgi:hypothetical protein
MQQGNLGDGGGVCNLFEGDSDLARKRDGVCRLEIFFSFLFFFSQGKSLKLEFACGRD